MEWKEYANQVNLPYSFWDRLKWLFNRQTLQFKFSVFIKTGKDNIIRLELPRLEIKEELKP